MWDNAILLRKIANTLVVISALAVAYGIAHYVLSLPGLFPLKSVHLNALPQRVSAAELSRVMRGEARGNLFTVDIGHLRQSLEKLPWVRSVSIRREFPHALNVTLEEHQAFARWNNSALVNQHGETFDAKTEQALPVFFGPNGSSAEVAQHYVQFNRQLVDLGLSVAQIALSPRHAWQLRLTNGVVLELGREDMQQRLAGYVAVYPYAKERIRAAAGADTVKYMDLRYRNGFAVRRVSVGKEQRADQRAAG